MTRRYADKVTRHTERGRLKRRDCELNAENALLSRSLFMMRIRLFLQIIVAIVAVEDVHLGVVVLPGKRLPDEKPFRHG